MKKLILSGCLLSGLLLTACQQKQDVVDNPNKDGAIETILSCEHRDGFDVLSTTHKIWVKNQLYKVVVHNDTLITLGQTRTSGEDAGGETRSVEIPKEYEFYITVQ